MRRPDLNRQWRFRRPGQHEVFSLPDRRVPDVLAPEIRHFEMQKEIVWLQHVLSPDQC